MSKIVPLYENKLTIEDIKKTERYKNLTDEEAIHLLHSIEIYVSLCFKVFMRQQALDDEQNDLKEAA